MSLFLFFIFLFMELMFGRILIIIKFYRTSIFWIIRVQYDSTHLIFYNIYNFNILFMFFYITIKYKKR